MPLESFVPGAVTFPSSTTVTVARATGQSGNLQDDSDRDPAQLNEEGARRGQHASVCDPKVELERVAVRGILHRQAQVQEYKTVGEVQEGFRPNRSTKRMFTKLQSLLERACRRYTVSVMLYLDIKNVVNTINHRAILAVLRACGYPEQDVELFRRMYTGPCLMVANLFGLSATR
jgi:hypothetical protein